MTVGRHAAATKTAALPLVFMLQYALVAIGAGEVRTGHAGALAVLDEGGALVADRPPVQFSVRDGGGAAEAGEAGGGRGDETDGAAVE